MQYTNTQINKHLWSDYGYCIKDYSLSLNGLSLHIFGGGGGGGGGGAIYKQVTNFGVIKFSVSKIIIEGGGREYAITVSKIIIEL